MINGLSGIKVIETAAVLAGPLAGRLLADLGADVIHVERLAPVSDPALNNPSLLQKGRAIASDINYVEENTNCNKRSMVLDITGDTGNGILQRLIAGADVLLTNFRPYELKKFNLEYEILSKSHPGLVQANLTAWGKNGPHSNLPGYDFNAFWTRSGLMHVLLAPGMEPFSTPVGWGDRITAMVLAYGITAALLVRERTGRGQEIDTSLLQSSIFMNANDIGGTLVTGKDRQNVARSEIANALLNSYQTRDNRWLRIAINKPVRDWEKFCRVIGRPDLVHDPRFEKIESRYSNHYELFQILEQTFAGKTLAEWTVILNEANLPWGPISSLPEAVADIQAKENRFYRSYNHPVHGGIEIVGNPVNFSRIDTEIKRPAPRKNEHTEEILRECGYTPEEIAIFKQKGVIGA